MLIVEEPPTLPVHQCASNFVLVVPAMLFRRLLRHFHFDGPLLLFHVHPLGHLGHPHGAMAGQALGGRSPGLDVGTERLSWVVVILILRVGPVVGLFAFPRDGEVVGVFAVLANHVGEDASAGVDEPVADLGMMRGINLI